jgi:hypothetical protein
MQRILTVSAIAALVSCGSGGGSTTDAGTDAGDDTTVADIWSEPVMDADPDSIGPGCVADGTDVRLHANIETVGVVVSGAGLPSAAQLFHRAAGETPWREDHPLVAVAGVGLAGSLFGLAGSTDYEVRVVGVSIDTCLPVTTKPEEIDFVPSRTLYVDADAEAGGDGSEASPFATIQAGVDAASPGTEVLVADGLYHEQVEVEVSGSEGAYVRIAARGDGAVVDGSQSFDGGIWTPHPSVDGVYNAEVGGSCWYLARDGERFYRYNDMDGLLDGLGDDAVPMDEGFYVDDGDTTLWVRSPTDPSTHTWSVPRHDRGFALDGARWIWIEGFEIRFYGQGRYGRGVDVRDSSHVVVRENVVHHVPSGIVVRRSGDGAASDDVRIEHNEVFDSPVDSWPWDAVKGTSMEGSAIVLSGGAGAIARGNTVHHIFNGIYTGLWGDLENTSIAFDVDVYRNTTHHIGDDGFEPEGACINNRFRSNTFTTGHSGISLAPITHGPVWIVRNVLSDFDGTGFKWSNDSDGPVLVYHNTSYTNRPDTNGMGFSGPFFDTTFRNNVFTGTRYAFESTLTGLTGHDWDHDDWYTTRTEGPRFKWQDVRYDTVADLCTATGLECHGYEHAPGFADAPGGDLSLDAASPNVDAALPLPGINDEHLGGGPDLGAIESH